MKKDLFYKMRSVSIGISVSQKKTYSREEYIALGKQKK